MTSYEPGRPRESCPRAGERGAARVPTWRGVICSLAAHTDCPQLYVPARCPALHTAISPKTYILPLATFFVACSPLSVLQVVHASFHATNLLVRVCLCGFSNVVVGAVREVAFGVDNKFTDCRSCFQLDVTVAALSAIVAIIPSECFITLIVK